MLFLNIADLVVQLLGVDSWHRTCDDWLCSGRDIVYIGVLLTGEGALAHCLLA